MSQSAGDWSSVGLGHIAVRGTEIIADGLAARLFGDTARLETLLHTVMAAAPEDNAREVRHLVRSFVRGHPFIAQLRVRNEQHELRILEVRVAGAEGARRRRLRHDTMSLVVTDITDRHRVSVSRAHTATLSAEALEAATGAASRIEQDVLRRLSVAERRMRRFMDRYHSQIPSVEDPMFVLQELGRATEETHSALISMRAWKGDLQLGWLRGAELIARVRERVARACPHVVLRFENCEAGAHVLAMEFSGRDVTDEILVQSVQELHARGCRTISVIWDDESESWHLSAHTETEPLHRREGDHLASARDYIRLIGGSLALAENYSHLLLTLRLPGLDRDRKPANLGLKILLADDHQPSRMIMRVVLQQLGHALTLVSSGQAAVDLVRAGERFDLILLDMHMPGLNGAQTARQIHAQLASHCPPMAAFTADLKSVPADLVATGVFRDCLSKPLNVAHLAQLLEDVINEQQADTRADDIPDLSLYRTAS